jgi:hypothetical protein
MYPKLAVGFYRIWMPRRRVRMIRASMEKRCAATLVNTGVIG